jgi:hypothetical protein
LIFAENGDVRAQGQLQVGGTNVRISSSASGVATLLNSSATGFDSLLFGSSGTTYNRLKHIGAGVLGVKLADDSAYSFIRAKLQLETGSTPSSASDTGVANEVRWDSSYIYVCVATDTWKRAAIATW